MLFFPYYKAFHYHGRSDISGYLIIIRLYKCSAMEEQTYQILTALFFYRMLKYSALFIVVLSVEVNGFNVDKFIKLLVNHSVNDVIVLVYESNKIVRFYTYNPYELPSGQCGSLYQSILINECYFNDNDDAVLRNRTTDFEIIPNLEGCEAFLDGFPIESLAILERSTSNPYYFSGFSNRSVVVVIFKYIFEAMKMTINTNVLNIEERKDHLIIDLDLYYYQSHGEQFIRYYTATYYWFLQKSEVLQRWSTILCVFSNYLWICIFFVLLCTTIILQYMSKSANYVPPWWLNLVSLHLGIGIREPKEHYLRIIFLSWLIYSFSINTIFQCFFTSYLVDILHQHQIDTFEELVEENYELIYAQDNIVLIGNVANTTSYLKWIEKLEDSLLYLHNGGKRAVFIPHESVSYFYNTICDGNVGNNLHRIIDSQKQSHLIIHFSNKHFEKRIYVLLNRLIESGIPDKLVNDFLYPRAKSFKSMLDMNSNELVNDASYTKNNSLSYESESDLIDFYYPFSIMHMRSAFLLYFIGLCVNFFHILNRNVYFLQFLI
ncbi:hypothetical protein L9F63_019924 [Diploptera punctata]|uniref:Uncharacterized protein n=1 Tax=Diploptera punctata TaxID=6984 RepID=A0AAD7ZTJ5_DIPPU|nr:hypothetical protein L9F63_019924 [Diploptera punctata]